jgi:Kelch motif protein/galactose oxidase-like protein/flagellar hook capping protein FlgD
MPCHATGVRLALALLVACTVVCLESAPPASGAPARAPSPTPERGNPAGLEAWQREVMRAWQLEHPGTPPPPELLRGPAAPAAAEVNDGAWSTTTPPIRYQHAAVYDSRRDRMIVFGGFGLSGTSGGIFNDVWTLSLADPPTWRQLTTAGTQPLGRYSCSAVYDRTGDRLIVFGGTTSTGFPSNDAWALDFKQSVPTWTQLAPIGSPPTPRTDMSAVFDPRRNRMVIFGGLDSTGYNLNDTWVLTLAEPPIWIQLLRAGAPPERRSAAMAYDSLRDQIIVQGGFGVSPDLNDTWTLGLGTTAGWVPVFATGPPPGRHNHTAIVDPVRDRLVIFGGGSLSTTFNDVWALPLGGGTAWTLLTPAGRLPVARFGHAMIFDPPRDRIVVCAGRDTTGLAALSAILRGDTWELNFAANAWAPLPALTRSGHAMVWDPLRDRLVVFGGNDGASDRNDTWTLPLTDNGVWAPLTVQGPTPSARQGAAMAYDVVRDQVLMFGGNSGATCNNELWRLTPAGTPAWSQLTPLGTPPGPREGARIWYDRARDRLVLVGGHQTSSEGEIWYNDVWSLSLATLTWQRWNLTGAAPGGRAGHLLVYDSKRDRLLIQGGTAPTGAVLSDTWALSLGATPAWSALAPTGAAPALSRHVGMYDPVRDRIVLFSGWGGSPAYYRGDAKALSLSGTPAWSALAPTSTGSPRPRMSATGVYDPRRDRFVLFGGYGSYPSRLGTLDDTWYLTWGAPVSVSAAAAPAFALRPPTPNPMRAITRIAFTLPAATRVRAAVFDAAGRRMRVLADHAFPAGPSQLEWDGRDATGGRAAAGMYFVRVEAAGQALVQRLALMR